MSISSAKKMSRRALFLAPLGREMPATAPPPRLPWADSKSITENCTACMDCADACPENIIVASGTVVSLDFAASGCSFCGDCGAACPESVFWPKEDRDQTNAFTATVRVSKDCLAAHSVICQSCRDFCDEDAISFLNSNKAIALPTINEDRCTGCGFCVSGCPADALSIVFAAEPARVVTQQIGSTSE